MPTIVRLALENAGVAALLAVVATALGMALRRRPAVAHVLWVLVLVKLVTPPLWTFEPPRLARPVRSAEVPVARPSARATLAEFESLTVLLEPSALAGEVVPDSADDQREALIEAPAESPSSVVPALLLVWAFGSLAMVVLTSWRVIQFRRVLAAAKVASEEVCELVEHIAGRIGLRRRPEVVVIAGAVSPMVWSCVGRPLLIVPTELWRRLNGLQRETLVTHELAHLKRGDDRVRWLEQFVTVLFWWHPVVWWARRALREAEELCCDAWVVSTVPGAARAYAEALVETVDFLNSARTSTPASASGFGHVHQLKRRLVMIMRGTTRRSLGFGGGLFALTASAVLLPFSPSWAQKADDAKKEPVEVVITKSAPTPAVSAGTLAQTYLFQANKAAESQEVFTDVSQPIKEAIERLRAEARKLEKSPVPDGEDALRAKALKRAVGELDRVFCPRVQDMRIEVGQQHLSANLASEAPTTPAAATNAEKLRAEMAELTQLVARRAVDLNEANRRLQEARRKLAESSGRIWDVSRGGVRMAPLPHYPAYQGEIATWLPAPASASGRPEAPNRDGERRLAEVEKKLDRLIKSLEKANEEKSTERQ